MSILLKHILRNINSNKFMSLLILLSTAISGALLFVALSIADVLNTVANNFESISTTFLLMFVVTSFLSIFVVYSSFKYIMALRIKVLGTFRSVGASKKICRNLLLLESLVYGLLSGIIAVILGIILLKILGNQLSGGQAKLILSPVNLLISFLFCVVLSILCAYFPIKSCEKYSVKEIILQTHTVREKSKLPTLIIGFALLGIGMLLTFLPALKYNEIFIILGLLCSLMGFVIFANSFIYYAFACFKRIFKNSLTYKNLKDSKAHINITVLLSIAVAVVFLISSANAVLIKATDESFAHYNYSVQVTGTELDNVKLDQIREIVGETNAAGLFYEKEIEVNNHIPLMNVYGLDFCDVEFFNFTPQPKSFGNSEIIISNDYLSRQTLSIGDKITMNNCEFTITGVINEMFPSGNIGLITKHDFETLFTISHYQQIAVKSDNPNETAKALCELGFETVAVAQMQKTAKQINADLFIVLNYIVVLSTVAGVFGVLNNLLIAFHSQKKERALLRSIGMSKSKNIRTTLAQSSLTGFVGGTLGLVGGMLLSLTIPALLLTFEFPAQPAPLSLLTATLCIACSVIICIFASLLSILNQSKPSIVQTLREEINS